MRRLPDAAPMRRFFFADAAPMRRLADAAPVRRLADAAPMRSIGGPQRPALDLYFFVCLASAMNTPLSFRLLKGWHGNCDWRWG